MFKQLHPTRQFIKFAAVGLVSNLIGYGLFLLITKVGVEPKLGMSGLYAVAVAIGYIGNRQWTFQHRGNWMHSAGPYFLVHLSGYSINLAILIVFVDHYGFPHEIVQGIAVFVVASYLFLVFKYIVFRVPAIGPGGRK